MRRKEELTVECDELKNESFWWNKKKDAGYRVAVAKVPNYISIFISFFFFFSRKFKLLLTKIRSKKIKQYALSRTKWIIYYCDNLGADGKTLRRTTKL